MWCPCSDLQRACTKREPVDVPLIWTPIKTYLLPAHARLACIEILSTLFRAILMLTPEDLLPALYLCSNSVCLRDSPPLPGGGGGGLKEEGL